MKSRSAACVLTIITAANTSGCRVTWDLDPKVLPRLNGFQERQTIVLPTLNREEQIEFNAGTELEFHTMDKAEAHAKFHRIFVNPTTFIGVERSTNRVLKVQLDQIQYIKAQKVSGSLTALAAVGGGLALLGALYLAVDGLQGFTAYARPLRQRRQEKPVRAPLRVDMDQLGQTLARDLDPAMKSALFAHWAEQASAECASIPAFLALARDLEKVSAPKTLIAAALRAAREEATHARLCTEIANEYAPLPIAPVMPSVPDEMDDDHKALIERLTLEAFWDGCVSEGAGAIAAFQASEATRDSKTRLALQTIAADERRHWQLAKDVIAYGLDVGGKRIRDKLVESVQCRQVEHEKQLLEQNDVLAMDIDADWLAKGGFCGTDMTQSSRIEAWEKSLALVPS